jgi:structural maintenance of chromosome 4
MLDNMIVDHVEQAQECIEYLRRQNLGRASFVALDKLSNKPIEPIQTPEGVPRLFDLIKPKDPKYAPAFYKAVRDTLVANDLDQANRIAYGTKRWRVVTLAGQLIDVSGTMSGGGGKPKSGGMSSKLASDVVSPEELKRFEKQNESAATELAQANLKLASLEDELEGLRRKGPALEMDIEKAQMALNTLRRRIEDSDKRMKQIQ